MKKLYSKIAIFFPIVVMLLWIVSLTLPSVFGTEIRLPIEGYDPRDILSGHYLQYQVNFGNDSICQTEPKIRITSKCVCLEEPKTPKAIAKATWTGNCDKRPPYCKLYIQGNCQNSRFTAGIERFYVPEAYKLNSVPKGANVVLKVLNGKTSTEDIEVNGKSLLQKSSP